MNESIADIFYVDEKGRIFEPEEITRFYELWTGETRENNEGGYIRFLDKIIRKRHFRVIVPSPRDLFDAGYKIRAIKLYRKQNNTTLMEAKQIVDGWEARRPK